MNHRSESSARRWAFLGLIALLAHLCSPVAKAQDNSTGPAEPPPDAQKIEKGRVLKTSTEMTLVNVTVTDPIGRLVTGLDRENFRVFENGAEQEIVKFTSEDAPVSILSLIHI